LKAYTAFNNLEIKSFRDDVKNTFRNHFLSFFNNKEDCNFDFYESILEPEEYKLFVEANFRKLNGKCFCTIDNRLLLAKHTKDEDLEGILQYFKKIETLS
jgi:hypothetical protein